MQDEHRQPCTKEPYGFTTDGSEVSRFILTNGPLEVTLLEYGATIESIVYRRADGTTQALCKALDSLADYEQDAGYTGASIGPVANRMRNATYRIGDQEIKVTPNEGMHQLHGGPNGLHQCVWNGEITVDARGPSVQLESTHVDGTDGYIGNLLVRVRYTLDNEGGFWIEYTGICDAPRPVSLTSHPYFGFEGERTQHRLLINSVRQLEVDDSMLPTGIIVDVSNTHTDFSQRKDVCGVSLDNTYLYPSSDALIEMAVVTSPSMMLTVYSNQPALQAYVSHDADAESTWVCLEPHGYVDATRYSNFESVVLLPNQVYRHCTKLCFRLNDPS